MAEIETKPQIALTSAVHTQSTPRAPWRSLGFMDTDRRRRQRSRQRAEAGGDGYGDRRRGTAGMSTTL